MAESSDDLERMSREQLILKARVLGVERAELMTRVEMRDEIVRRSEPDLAQQKRARGFLGVARDLVASVVEAGLNLPDAAAIIRGDNNREADWKGPPPVATVTLAEIYAAQGHLERALRMLDEVLAKEPDHDPARALRTRLASSTDLPVAPARRRQRVSFADPPTASEPLEPASAPVNANDPASTFANDPASASGNVPVPVPVPDPSSASPSPELPAESAPEPVIVFAEPAPVEAAAPEPEPVIVFADPAPPESPIPESASANVNDPAPASGNLNVEVPDPAPPSPSLSLEPDADPEPAPSPAVLTLSLAGQRQIYWELPSQSLTPLRAHSPGGRPVLRIITFRTRSGRVERQARDLTPDSEVGSVVLPGLRADAVVRAVLGWEAEGRFLPYLVASDVGSGSPSAVRNGPFRANRLVGAVAPEVEQRALMYCGRRPAH